MSTHPPPSPQMHHTALSLQPATGFLPLKISEEILLARKLCTFQEEKVKDLQAHSTRHLACSEDGKDKGIC